MRSEHFQNVLIEKLTSLPPLVLVSMGEQQTTLRERETEIKEDKKKKKKKKGS